MLRVGVEIPPTHWRRTNLLLWCSPSLFTFVVEKSSHLNDPVLVMNYVSVLLLFIARVRFPCGVFSLQFRLLCEFYIAEEFVPFLPNCIFLVENPARISSLEKVPLVELTSVYFSFWSPK